MSSVQHAASYSPLETSSNASRHMPDTPPESGLVPTFQHSEAEGLQPCNASYSGADGYPQHNEQQAGLEAYSQPHRFDGLQAVEDQQQPAQLQRSRGARRFLNRRVLIPGFIVLLVMVVCITVVMCYVTGRFGDR